MVLGESTRQAKKQKDISTLTRWLHVLRYLASATTTVATIAFIIYLVDAYCARFLLLLQIQETR